MGVVGAFALGFGIAVSLCEKLIANKAKERENLVLPDGKYRVEKVE